MASSTFSTPPQKDHLRLSALFDRTSNRADNVAAPIYLPFSSRSFTVLSKIKRTWMRPRTPVVFCSRTKDTEDDNAESDKERERWKPKIEEYKEFGEIIHNLLEISLAPCVPASLRNIPTKYIIITRLWTFAFHKVLESLRRASFASPFALEHLQNFIYHAYTSYTGSSEESSLERDSLSNASVDYATPRDVQPNFVSYAVHGCLAYLPVLPPCFLHKSGV
ncbi:hypothetical protein R3P38DRAFT_1330759 [Favolaschia claudopus]|uniref:Uncharacterized protein n=1 Tax=Favolaschia claudopus TaxID=2862362 RepID=A0AAW0AUA8_9AGAR